uniref:Secreted peptide n=1 Tax=Anopheles braziliensis TaxID=58242 RepID=A0A2M3ZLT5_9DIPT
MLPLIELILLVRPVPVLTVVVVPCHRHGITLGVDASSDDRDGGGERSGRTYDPGIPASCLCCCCCCCCCCW